MAELAEIVAFLDRELRISEIPDYPGAMNGLQVANSGNVTRIIAAVDASLPVIEKAVEEGGPALLIVHHGMFWQGAQPVTGAFYKKLKTSMDADLAVYSSHLPLDIHPEWGNNVQLAKALGLHNLQPFFEKRGLYLGLCGEWRDSRRELLDRLNEILGAKVHHCPGGPERPLNVAVITGGAGSEISGVASLGADTFVTGEGPHWSYSLAEELGVNLIYGGHYLTETFGVRALSRQIASKWNLPFSFIDHPSGL